MSRKNIVITAVSFIVFVVVVIWIYLWFNTATITIHAPGAEVFVKQGQANEFKLIGNEQAIFKTRSKDEVFVEARNQAGSSQKSIIPIKRKNIVVELEIKPLAKAEFVANGPITYPFIEEGFIYGINPHTREISVRTLGGDAATSSLPTLPLLPFVQKIIWFDSKNFIYVPYGGTVGVITNAVLDNEAVFTYINAAVTPNKNSVALVGYDGLYLAHGINIADATKIADALSNSSPSVFADDKYLYFVNILSPNPSEEEEITEPSETSYQVFSHDGQKKYQFNLPITDETFRIAAVNETTFAILSRSGLELYNAATNESREFRFSFGEVKDLITTQGQLLLLGSAGLWELSVPSNEYHQIASYPEGEEYVPGSLSLLNGELYFSTSITDAALLETNTTSQSSVYKLPL